MHIWLIQVGEPLPCDEGDQRLFRTGVMAEIMQRKGHRVTWWAADFNHFTRRSRAKAGKCVEMAENYEIILLDSPGYQKSVSIARLRDHAICAKNFCKTAETAQKPDIILCSYPTVELSEEAVKYGKIHNIPVVLDIRDIWPDAFLDLAPKLLRPLARLVLTKYYHKAAYALRGADAIIANTPQMVEWGRNLAKIPLKPFDHGVPLAYPDLNISAEKITQAESFWNQLGVTRDKWDMVCCFFGALGKQFDIETVVQAFASPMMAKEKIACVICGTGDNLDNFRALAAHHPNIFFPGWVGAAEIRTLMRRCDVGLGPYINTVNFSLSIPNKPLEYISEGLPVITCLDGVLRKMLEKHNCGVFYTDGNAESLADSVLSLRNTPARLREMSANAKKLFAEKYRADTVYGELCTFLERMAGKS